ncbi:MAG: fluoride efflux transporter CrcB [Acidobacteriota bacterium]
MRYLVIAAGGVLGTLTRYFLSVWVNSTYWGKQFPYGTLIVNISGSFLIGLIMGLSLQRAQLHAYWQLLLVSGFCGAYTTFSTFEFEMLQLMLKGQARLALMNALASVLIGLLAVWGGWLLAQRIA